MSQALYAGVNFKTVTPSDTDRFTPFANGEIKRCEFLLIGGSGDVAIRNEDGTTSTIVGLLAGGQYAISTDQVLATGTTATDIQAAFQSAGQHATIESN